MRNRTDNALSNVFNATFFGIFPVAYSIEADQTLEPLGALLLPGAMTMPSSKLVTQALNSFRPQANTAMARMLGDRAPVNGVNRDVTGAPFTYSRPLNLPSLITMKDWDDLLFAISARLTQIAGEHHDSISDLNRHDTLSRVQDSVLECGDALRRLHISLDYEFDHRLQLELKVFELQTSLAQARTELAGTQAGVRHARHLAMHDALTTLPNRAFFRERLGHALMAGAGKQPPPLAVLYIDLDGFKAINDTHGHCVGDELLRIVAARLARAVRAEDLVGRLGGDEFACLLADLRDRDRLRHLACKLFDTVSAPLNIGKLKLAVHPSIGIAMCPVDGKSVDALLKNADSAMYAAKRRQRGYAFFDRPADV